MAKTGRPQKDTEQVSLRLEKETIAQIDDLRKIEEDLPSRPEMIRRIIDRHLKGGERQADPHSAYSER